MPAYWIARCKINDPVEYRKYTDLVPAIIAKYGGRVLARGGPYQIVEGPDGTKYHVQAAKGSTSTIRGGKVTMYTEELKGNLFGLIPITFDPEHPPPLNIPEAYFTNVEVKQAGQFGGNLTVPGLHQFVD